MHPTNTVSINAIRGSTVSEFALAPSKPNGINISGIFSARAGLFMSVSSPGTGLFVEDSAIRRMEDQIAWYDSRAKRCQLLYKSLRTIVIAAGASVPIAVAIQAPSVVTASLGVTVVVVEGFQQLNQFHENWIRYRSTCEALRRERSLFLPRAADYAKAKNPSRLLALRVEEIISHEHTRWLAGRETSVREDEAP